MWPGMGLHRLAPEKSSAAPLPVLGSGFRV